MAGVKIIVRKLLSDLGVFEKKVNYAVEQVLTRYVSDFVGGLSAATPLGTPEDKDPMSKYYKLYALRNRVEGHRIEGGLARGNWRVTFRDGVTGITQNYDKSPLETEDRAFDRMANEYRFGRPLYIVNNVKYINLLRDGYSPQAPEGVIDGVANQYKSLAGYRNIFQAALR